MLGKKCKKCKKVKLTGKYKNIGTCSNCTLEVKMPPPPTKGQYQNHPQFNKIILPPRSDISKNSIKRGKRDDQRHFTPKQREEIFLRDNHMCRECRSSQNLESDHIIPWAKGGKTIVDNAQTLCSSCNKAKSDN